MNTLLPDEPKLLLAEADIAAACSRMQKAAKQIADHTARRRKADADDLYSTAMLAVFDCARQFDAGKRDTEGKVPKFYSTAQAWIRRAILRELDHERHPPVGGIEDFAALAESRAEEEQDAWDEFDAEPDPDFRERSMLDAIRDPEMREAVRLSVFEKLDVHRIAERMGIEWGRVRLHLRNAATEINRAQQNHTGSGLLDLIEQGEAA